MSEELKRRIGKLIEIFSEYKDRLDEIRRVGERDGLPREQIDEITENLIRLATTQIPDDDRGYGAVMRRYAGLILRGYYVRE